MICLGGPFASEDIPFPIKEVSTIERDRLLADASLLHSGNMYGLCL